jgi:hypothetical protein
MDATKQTVQAVSSLRVGGSLAQSRSAREPCSARWSVTGLACSKRPEGTSPWGERCVWHTGQLFRLRLLLAL